MTAPLVLVAAVARNGAIGAGNRLPWRLKTDLQRFRAITMGKPVIIGRRTFESIGRPLPGRHLVVLSRNPPTADQPGVQGATTLEDALAVATELAAAHGAPEIVVAGGAAVYEQTIGRACRLDLTEVDLEPSADAWFPSFDRASWRESSRQPHGGGPEDGASFSFVTLERR